MRVVIAPNWFAAALRSLLVLVAMLGVTALMLWAKGPPQSSRAVDWNDITLFAPRLVKGVVQLGAETLLVVVVTWGCREGLKIRL